MGPLSAGITSLEAGVISDSEPYWHLARDGNCVTFGTMTDPGGDGGNVRAASLGPGSPGGILGEQALVRGTYTSGANSISNCDLFPPSRPQTREPLVCWCVVFEGARVLAATQG